MALATLGIHDPQFLSEVRANLETALWRYGFALSPQEMQEARDYLTGKTDLEDEAIVNELQSPLASR
jgi:hypothetical protein